MNKPVILIGHGGHASVLIEILQEQGREIIGYTDVVENKRNTSLTYLGTDSIIQEKYNFEDLELVLGIGSTKVTLVREKHFRYFTELGYSFSQVIHPTAIISPSARLGEGVQIMAGAIIQTNTSIGDYSIVNTGTIVDHDCKIGKNVHIAPRSILSGRVEIDDHCHIGTGTTIINNIKIGEKTTIGAGAVVIRNIGSRAVAYGVPAKEV